MGSCIVLCAVVIFSDVVVSGCVAAAAKALYDTELGPMDICKKAMTIAADMCVYTNGNFVCDQLPDTEGVKPAPPLTPTP